MKGIVDRFEGDYVIIEINGVTQDCAAATVSDDVKAGDTVRLVDGIWIKDEAETASRTEKIKGLMDSLWED